MKARPRKRVLLVVSDYHFIAVLKGTFTQVFFHPDHHLNAHQCHRHDKRWKLKARG